MSYRRSADWVSASNEGSGNVKRLWVLVLIMALVGPAMAAGVEAAGFTVTFEGEELALLKSLAVRWKAKNLEYFVHGLVFDGIRSNLNTERKAAVARAERAEEALRAEVDRILRLTASRKQNEQKQLAQRRALGRKLAGPPQRKAK